MNSHLETEREEEGDGACQPVLQPKTTAMSIDPEEAFSDVAMFDPSAVPQRREKRPISLCIHCLRAYPTGWYRLAPSHPFHNGPSLACPYKGCDGDVMWDAFDYLRVARENGYPWRPEWGKEYPLHPDEEE